MLDDELGDWRGEERGGIPPRVRVQTFGHFEVFVNGKPLTFERKKAKELLAYLVDRHGASVTTEHMAAVLYEDENYDHKLKSRVTSASSSLQSTLKGAGVADILVKSWGHLAIDPEKIKCDAYDFEKWDMSAVNTPISVSITVEYGAAICIESASKYSMRSTRAVIYPWAEQHNGAALIQAL